MKDLRGKRPIDTYPILVTVEDGYLYDGSGSAVINVNITASQAISASYEIIYETSSSYAETASLAGTSSYAITSSFSVTSSTALHLIVSESIIPNADGVYNLGSSDYVFINVYANNFFGNASTADNATSASYAITSSLSLQSATSSFPWNQTGSNISYTAKNISNNIGGNVGIGTPNPQRMLHISTASSLNLSIGAFENIDMTQGNGIVFSFRSPTTTTEFVEMGGISLSSMEHTHSIRSASIGLFNTNGANGNTGLTVRGNGGVSAGAYRLFQPPDNGLIVSGSVGIGTATPTSKLDVNGNTFITGTLNVSTNISAESYLSAGNYYNTYTNTGSYVLSEIDNGKLVVFETGSNIIVSSSLVYGFNCRFYQSGSDTGSQIIVVPETGVQIRNWRGHSGSAAQYVLLSLIKLGSTSEFILSGDTNNAW